MAQNRYYSSIAVATTLAADCAAGDTTIKVAATTGFPLSYPYTLVVDGGTGTQEVVSVTAASGTSLTVQRGQDGSAAVSHSIGAGVEHDVSARDYDEPQKHLAATTGVHGVTGPLASTTDAQTLTNKTLTAPAINSGVIDAASTIGGALASDVATAAGLKALAGAWTKFTPTITAGGGGTLPIITGNGAYLAVGDSLFVTMDIGIQSGGTAATFIFHLPGGYSVPAGLTVYPFGAALNTVNLAAAPCYINLSGSTGALIDCATGKEYASTATSTTLATNNSFVFNFHIPLAAA